MQVPLGPGRAPVTFSDHRCFALSCPYVLSLPTNKPALPCRGGCGITFCSETCQRDHHEYGHKFACHHIRAVRNGSPIGAETAQSCSSTSASDDSRRLLPEIPNMKISEIRAELENYGISTQCFLEKPELINALEQARLEGKVPIGAETTQSCSSTSASDDSRRLLPEIPNMKISEIRAELESYGISTKCFLEKPELIHALEQARLEGKVPTNHPSTAPPTGSNSPSETAAATAEAQSRMERNALGPAVVWRGRVDTRRFRVGQRVECWQMGSYNPGTIVDLLFRQPSEDGKQEVGPPLPYEIELDTGMYCSAPLDHDIMIRRMMGAPVVLGELAPPLDLLPDINAEFRSGMPHCIAARAAGGSAQDSPVLDKYRCSSCGKAFKHKLNVCTRCRTAAYCDASCQREHYGEHRTACKEVAKARGIFLSQNAEAAATPHGRRVLRQTSLAQNRYETLLTFLMDKTGMPYGGAHLLRNLITRAVDASRESDAESAMRALAAKLESTDMDSIMSNTLVTTDYLTRLVAAVLHFSETAPDLAAWCSAGVDLFFEVSMLRVLVPWEDSSPEEQAEREAKHKKWAAESKRESRASKKKGKKR